MRHHGVEKMAMARGQHGTRDRHVFKVLVMIRQSLLRHSLLSRSNEAGTDVELTLLVK